MNVIIPENGSKNGRMLKLLVEVEVEVEIELGQPLMRGTKFKLEKELVWIDFRYEQLPAFYFYCGVIGHQEKRYDRKIIDSNESKVRESQYGEWLRAQIRSWGGGRRRGKEEKIEIIQRKNIEIGKKVITLEEGMEEKKTKENRKEMRVRRE